MRKICTLFVLFCFCVSNIALPASVYADELVLPAPGKILHLTAPLAPPTLRGLTIHPENPLRFDFIVDKGDVPRHGGVRDEYTKLIKYFLAALTIPEDDLWVNLSPYEKDRIVPKEFGLTEMGRDLLAQDYILKQIMASLTYPENGLGKKFWEEVYKKAREQYGAVNIPINTFNKVWIVPDKAVVYEHKDKAFIIESHLKVLLEEDYLALSKSKYMDVGDRRGMIHHAQHEGLINQTPTEINQLDSKIVRQILIPAITKEVNEGKNFANLRQIYASMILAAWYKKTLKNSILNKVYSNKKKITGVEFRKDAINGVSTPQEIYQRYLTAFKKGVYNFIKEDHDPRTNQMTPRKYFSGGVKLVTDVRTVNRLSLNGVQFYFTIARDGRLDEVQGQYSSAVITNDRIQLPAKKTMRTIFKTQGINDFAMIGESGYRHIWLMKDLLEHMRQDNARKLIVYPQEKDIFDKFLKGRRVLNIGPEDNTFSGVLLDQNIMTVLRDRGIEAFALSPAKPRPAWKKWFINGVVQDMGLKNSSFDDIVTAFLFDDVYFETGFETLPQLLRMYTNVALELRRVLKNNGRFYIINPGINLSLMSALVRERFEIMELENKTFWGGINHKTDSAQNSEPSSSAPGGIDLTRKKLNLQTKGEGVDFNLPFDPHSLDNAAISGLTPVIVQITPVSDLQLLGLTGN